MSNATIGNEDLRFTTIPLNHESGRLPALGFGTLIPDLAATRLATRTALEVGFRQFDCAERYRNEKEVGEGMQEVFKRGAVKRDEVFIGTKLWNNNHRPQRVKAALEASLKRLQLDYVDLYYIHTPFAFKPGEDQDPRDEHGRLIYDEGVTLMDTWHALETLVDEGKCKAIGLSDISLSDLKSVTEAARIQPAALQVESHPYLPQWELLEFCKLHGIAMLAIASLGHGIEPRLLDDPTVITVARQVGKTPAQVLLAWALQRGTAPITTSKTPSRIAENFNVSRIPEDAIADISAMQNRHRFDDVVNAGIPGFIPQGR
jgi:alcohol dehydrogenase (NADP+)